MRWLILLGLTFITFGGCSLEDALEDAPCETADDCLGSQACVLTQHQTANGLPGWCRSDGKCAAGRQEGCIASGGACTELPLIVVTDAAGNAYCCDTGGVTDASVIPSADLTSAQCVVCPSDQCTEGDATEPCSEGDARCVVEAGSCGCRVPEAQLENSECEDDATCGEGFVCTRTLEQAAEPDELRTEERDQEPGWCRPEETPECVSGGQEGCRTEVGCSSGNERCTDQGRCYCCDTPADTTGFSVRVYAEEPGTFASAACIECPNDCEGTTPYACTALEDPTCTLMMDPCGCSTESQG